MAASAATLVAWTCRVRAGERARSDKASGLTAAARLGAPRLAGASELAAAARLGTLRLARALPTAPGLPLRPSRGLEDLDGEDLFLPVFFLCNMSQD
jgi:hypothetical protein